MDEELKKDVKQAQRELDSLDAANVAYGISKIKSEERRIQRQLQLKRYKKYLLIGTTVAALLGTNAINHKISFNKGYNSGAQNETEITDVKLAEISDNYTIDNAPDELLIKWANYALAKYQDTENDNDNIESVEAEFRETMEYYDDYIELKDQFYNKTQSDKLHAEFIRGIKDLNDAVKDDYKFGMIFSKAIIDEDGNIKVPSKNVNYDFLDNSDYVQEDDKTVVYIPVDEIFNEGYTLH